MSKKILIIEDDKLVRENVNSLLTEEGYLSFPAKDGNEGIRIAKREHPDLIICDIMMKGTDGYGVLKALSKDNSTKSIPFIFLTAKVEKNDIRLGMNLGADDYLFKPFDADDLLSSIESRLKRIEVLKADLDKSHEYNGKEKYAPDDKIFVQVNNKTYPINITDVMFISAQRQYSSIKTTSGHSYLLRKSISRWETILPENKFLRIHRSTIINIDYLKTMESWHNSSFIIYLKNIDVPFIISRRYSAKLRGRLLK